MALTNMLAIISIGNQQFTVSKDQIFLADRTNSKIGSELSLPVLLLSNDSKTSIGTPEVPGAKVTLKVLEDVRGKKVQGFKYKKRKFYRRSWGHRHELQKFQVVSIQGA